MRRIGFGAAVTSSPALIERTQAEVMQRVAACGQSSSVQGHIGDGLSDSLTDIFGSPVVLVVMMTAVVVCRSGQVGVQINGSGWVDGRGGG